MANYEVPSLCGASLEFNDFLKQFDQIEAFLLTNLDTAITAVKAQLDILFTDLGNFIRTFVDELPELPSLNLQAMISDLLAIDITIPANLQKYLTMIETMTSDFGDFLAAAGEDLETLISDGLKAITDGLNICGAVPNYQITAAGDFARFSNAVTQAAKAPIEEETSTANTNSFIVQQQVLLAAKDTEFKTSLKKTESSTTVSISTASQNHPIAGVTNTIPVTTPKDALTARQQEIKRFVEHRHKRQQQMQGKSDFRPTISDGELKARANISGFGFSHRTGSMREQFTAEDIKVTGTTHTITLKRAPTVVRLVGGFGESVLEYNKEKGRKLSKGVRIEAEAGTPYLSDPSNNPEYDQFSLSFKDIIIKNIVRTYDGKQRDDGVVYVVHYAFPEPYDPSYK